MPTPKRCSAPAKQRACLFRIAINEALQIMRSPYRRWEQLGVDAGEQESTQSHLVENMQAKEDFRVAWKPWATCRECAGAWWRRGRCTPPVTSTGTSADGTGHRDVLDWLHEKGKQRAAQVPEFDVERTLSRARAARDAGAVNFWTVLNPGERAAFEATARERTFPAGTALMREGERAEEVMVILDGWTKVCLRERDREAVVAERGPGDLIGEWGHCARERAVRQRHRAGGRPGPGHDDRGLRRLHQRVSQPA